MGSPAHAAAPFLIFRPPMQLQACYGDPVGARMFVPGMKNAFSEASAFSGRLVFEDLRWCTGNLSSEKEGQKICPFPRRVPHQISG